jgi:hypothetical protein
MRNKNITLSIFLSREKERIARWVCATLSGCFRYGFRLSFTATATLVDAVRSHVRVISDTLSGPMDS